MQELKWWGLCSPWMKTTGCCRNSFINWTEYGSTSWIESNARHSLLFNHNDLQWLWMGNTGLSGWWCHLLCFHSSERHINVKDTSTVRKIIGPWKLINIYQWAIICFMLQNTQCRQLSLMYWGLTGQSYDMQNAQKLTEHSSHRHHVKHTPFSALPSPTHSVGYEKHEGPLTHLLLHHYYL